MSLSSRIQNLQEKLEEIKSDKDWIAFIDYLDKNPKLKDFLNKDISEIEEYRYLFETAIYHYTVIDLLDQLVHHKLDSAMSSKSFFVMNHSNEFVGLCTYFYEKRKIKDMMIINFNYEHHSPIGFDLHRLIKDLFNVEDFEEIRFESYKDNKASINWSKGIKDLGGKSIEKDQDSLYHIITKEDFKKRNLEKIEKRKKIEEELEKKIKRILESSGKSEDELFEDFMNGSDNEYGDIIKLYL